VRIVFLHPELGLGGAERLVLDAATHLRARGHQVVVWTSRLDAARAFPAAVDGTLDVRVGARALPAQVLQRLRAPCAILRMARLARLAARERADVVFADLVAHVLPGLRRRTDARLVFYCHFPDRLLAPARGGLFRLYRAPIDRLEARGLAAADRVLVNSRYTAGRVRALFPGIEPVVLHPGVDPRPADPRPAEPLLLALGRFDPAKNLGLAVDALAALRTRLSAEAFAPLRLVVAGGFDPRLREQHATVAALAARVRRHGVAERVEVRRSPPDAEVAGLLSRAACLLYTPVHEHFGYGPVEAMAAGCPVVAVNGGGPAETVVEGETGFLRPPEPEAFAEAAARLLADPAAAARMGEAGRARIAAHFSRAAFGARLDALVAELG
jgi:alpha-1,3/alpha-1,6-mannosyltransferase